MDAPIQAALRGYLGFFQVKNQGQNPINLRDEVQPVIDLRDWYFASNAMELQSVNLVVAGGFDGGLLSTLAVPANEMWYVIRYCALTGAMAAADAISFGPSVQFEPNTGGSVLMDQGTLGDAPLAGTAAGRLAGVTCGGFFAPPGAIFGVIVGECISAGNITLSLRVRAVKLAPL